MVERHHRFSKVDKETGKIEPPVNLIYEYVPVEQLVFESKFDREDRAILADSVINLLKNENITDEIILKKVVEILKQPRYTDKKINSSEHPHYYFDYFNMLDFINYLEKNDDEFKMWLGKFMTEMKGGFSRR